MINIEHVLESGYYNSAYPDSEAQDHRIDDRYSDQQDRIDNREGDRSGDYGDRKGRGGGNRGGGGRGR